jgi:hypothetical protein
LVETGVGTVFAGIPVGSFRWIEFVLRAVERRKPQRHKVTKRQRRRVGLVLSERDFFFVAW